MSSPMPVPSNGDEESDNGAFDYVNVNGMTYVARKFPPYNAWVYLVSDDIVPVRERDEQRATIIHADSSENESDDDDFTVTIKRKTKSRYPFARKSTGGMAPRWHLATPLARACCPTAPGWLKARGHCLGCPAAKSRRPRPRHYNLRPRPHRYHMRPRPATI
jgi:hypothetical protein